jgi:uncharacterized protein
VPETTPPANGSRLPEQARGVRRALYIALGLLFVGIAILGAILPVLPTTPWVLLASYFFARSSDRLSRWLRRSPYFGHLIHDWERHRGIRPRVKAFAVTMVVVAISSTILFSRAPEFAKWSAGILGLIGICVILFVVPTVRVAVDLKTKLGGEVPHPDASQNEASGSLTLEVGLATSAPTVQREMAVVNLQG